MEIEIQSEIRYLKSPILLGHPRNVAVQAEAIMQAFVGFLKSNKSRVFLVAWQSLTNVAMDLCPAPGWTDGRARARGRPTLAEGYKGGPAPRLTSRA